MRAMYTRFAHEHGLDTYVPPPFSVLKYLKEIERLERAYNTHFNTLWNMVSKAKFPLMKRSSRPSPRARKHIYEVANRDVEAWLKAVMSPLETQVREHHLQLRRRLDSVKAHPSRERRARRAASSSSSSRARRSSRNGRGCGSRSARST